MLPIWNTDHNVGTWHKTSPAYLYIYNNWHLQQEVTLVARFVTNRTALGANVLHKI